MGEEFIKLISDAFSNTEEFTAIEESEFMTEREKEVILMYYRDCKSPAEIAKELMFNGGRIWKEKLNLEALMRKAENGDMDFIFIRQIQFFVLHLMRKEEKTPII